MATTTVKAIDYWHNPFTPELILKMKKHPEIAQVIKWWHMEDRYKGYSLDQYMGMMDEAGVERILIPSFKMRSFQSKDMIYDFTVEEIVGLVSKRPDRMSGLYGINPYLKMEGVKELETAVTKHGFVGAMLHTYGFERAVNDRDYWPFYAKCAELDVPVIMQVGHSAEAMPSALARPILVDDIALYFPKLRVVCAHTGWPWVEETIALAWKHPNVYIGTSMHMPKYWDPSLIQFLNTRGKGKVLFGTDGPALLHKDCIDQIAAMNIKPDAREQLLRGAAMNVFKFK